MSNICDVCFGQIELIHYYHTIWAFNTVRQHPPLVADEFSFPWHEDDELFVPKSVIPRSSSFKIEQFLWLGYSGIWIDSYLLTIFLWGSWIVLISSCYSVMRSVCISKPDCISKINFWTVSFPFATVCFISFSNSLLRDGASLNVTSLRFVFVLFEPFLAALNYRKAINASLMNVCISNLSMKSLEICGYVKCFSLSISKSYSWKACVSNSSTILPYLNKNKFYFFKILRCGYDSTEF